MELFLQRLFDGLSQGSVYALIALGLVIIYRGTGHLNFAQGEMALFATYVVYQFGEWGWPIGLSLVVGILVGFALGRRRGGARASDQQEVPVCGVFFIVTLGLFQFLNWVDGAVWRGDQVLPNRASAASRPSSRACSPARTPTS